MSSCEHIQPCTECKKMICAHCIEDCSGCPMEACEKCYVGHLSKCEGCSTMLCPSEMIKTKCPSCDIQGV